ncbi:hypothetical protein BKA62DRAFT_618221, partial [Auriculariales sp. MPI-PUGE-AT-0066]
MRELSRRQATVVIGKNTIASSLCRQLAATGINVLSFFISRRPPEENMLGPVISTLAHQLGQCIPTARQAISAALQMQPPMSFRPIADQTAALLVNPLVATRAASETGCERVVIVIDAMDECN